VALNPLSYTERVVQSFLRYQLTAYPFADAGLHQQMRDLLSLEHSRQTPLLKGPFVSLSRAFIPGASIEQLTGDGVLHDHMKQLVPFPTLYGHQETAIRSIVGGKTTLISTGTGSGKSECFLYPIISRCLELRDQAAPPGICAVIVYPMNALAEDQLGRLRELLAGSGIPFGMYVGKTPEHEAEVTGRRLEAGSTRADYRAALKQARERGEGAAIHPPEEACSREKMRTGGQQPRLLLTNVKQLELLLTRQSDVELFDGARLDYLVFDEAHTFAGAQGAETACLIRRLRAFCDRDQDETACVATSATIVDKHNPDAARDFASRFFGVDSTEVDTVSEVYEEDAWEAEREVPVALVDPLQTLSDVLAAVDAEDADAAIREIWPRLDGVPLIADPWEAALYDRLSSNELLFQASQLLESPSTLGDLLSELAEKVHREVSEEELILWLSLGAAARRDGRPLVRPVVHAFLRGVTAAVVTFDGSNEPALHLSAEESEQDEDGLHLRLSTCTTCGQHYFEHNLAGFEYAGAEPGGGVAVGDAVYWEALDEARGGVRLLLLDHLISESDDEDDEENKRLTNLHLCRHCGAAHADEEDRCLACGHEDELVQLLAVQQKEDQPGYLTRCVCCGATGGNRGGRFREPIRPVRATNVADIHVLAQDMIFHAERKRLLVFADNRQDAAFQAGWMRDHARRFRLRALMMVELERGSLSVGDLTHRLDGLMESDDALSHSLLPEVWAVAPKEAGGVVHREERRYLLRILILREITASARQQIGLEPWGRMRVDYVGLDSSDPFVTKWSGYLGISRDDLASGIAGVLDLERRRPVLLDRTGHIFSKYWQQGMREIEIGYLPDMSGVPQGLKLTRDPSDHRGRVVQWLSSTGHRTTVMDIARKWGVEGEDLEDFIKELWAFLTGEGLKLLVPQTLMGSYGNALPDCHGTYQLDADKLMLNSSRGVYRCTTCRRRNARRPPLDKCMAWRCDGRVEFVAEDPDSYDLQLLDQDYDLLRPREHTAMVPHREREEIEELFKGDSDALNTLVCTQTLELGVDIGALDAVLMRNVPPLAANYWQRAGRAGRRHRMAVNLTYCRNVSHDRAYFADPLKMLGGSIDPPAFNMANELMVAKHVHAQVLTVLHQLAREKSGLTEPDREEITAALRISFPPLIRDYLFNVAGEVRPSKLDISSLHTVITKHQGRVEAAICRAFQQGWPAADQQVVSGGRLASHVLGMTSQLEAVIGRLRRRLRWALDQMAKLEDLRRRYGAFDDEQRSFYQRCGRLVRRMKGADLRDRRQAEGVDDVFTYGVLAAEGFLPGYGLDTGTVIGYAEVPRWVRGIDDFDLPRPAGVALREYVPGNRIYANGQQFVPRRYALDITEGGRDSITYEVSPESQAVLESRGDVTAHGGASLVTSIPVCDVTLVHGSRITDEEESRFQMGVAIYGRELEQHNGGQAYRWGDRPVHVRRAVRLTLVNVGSSNIIRSRNEFGYPVCRVCGQSVSPLSSKRQREDFSQKHLQWCGQLPTATAFHADLTADALTLPNCHSKEEAFSVLEGLRFAATEILDMEHEDLQVLVMGQVGSEQVDAMLYDPMPGGSGLLWQICESFDEIVVEAKRIAGECPGQCASSCIDCFRRYRNAFYHEHLNRHLLLERLEEWGEDLQAEHEIPPQLPATDVDGSSGQPVNVAEEKLRRMLEAASFPEGRWQEQRSLPRPLDTTTPDVTYDDPDDDERKILIYLDGLSEHIHGNPETRQRDREIRGELRSQDHDVIEITAVELDDPISMLRHFRRLARLLIGRDGVDRVRNEAETWFSAREVDSEKVDSVTPVPDDNSPGIETEVIEGPFERIEEPAEEDRYQTCVPIYSLQAAAGGFSEGHVPEPDGWAALDTGRSLSEGMFVAKVVGKSMEPEIPDGAWCLFRRDPGGSRQGKTVLAQMHGAFDPEGGASFTVKRYERVGGGDGDELGGEIHLRPVNKEFEPIVISGSNDDVSVIAEMIEVVG
jgi:ATP-dependent helicase YprA (DUF1998 family)/SOS-response transcriptional repressor LexA